ncbi:MAG: alpha/beta hydrolase, partial [Pseudomonadota bacterium]|nr:alpha/beta hydrolase [Pseudomonadota bacterium]
SFNAKIDDYANLSMPVLLVRGAHANKQMLVITETLQTCIPYQRSAVIDGSGHFLITSHPNDCAIVLADFLREIILE